MWYVIQDTVTSQKGIGSNFGQKDMSQEVLSEEKLPELGD